MPNIQYTTKGGVRWDTLSQMAYGTPDHFEQIIRANQDVPKFDVLPDGIVLDIPELPDDAETTDKDLLPPWKK